MLLLLYHSRSRVLRLFTINNKFSWTPFFNRLLLVNVPVSRDVTFIEGFISKVKLGSFVTCRLPLDLVSLYECVLFVDHLKVDSGRGW